VTDQQSLSHLITVQQLRAAGALDCPDWMRKSLGPPPKQGRDLFSHQHDVEEEAPSESETIDELEQDDDSDYI